MVEWHDGTDWNGGMANGLEWGNGLDGGIVEWKGGRCLLSAHGPLGAALQRSPLAPLDSALPL